MRQGPGLLRRPVGFLSGLAGLALVVCLLSGCSKTSDLVSLSPPTRSIRSADYEAMLGRWTRSAKIISLKHLDTTLRVHATCFSPEFIAAYVAHHEELFKVSGRERRHLLAEMNDSFKTHITFVVFAATTDLRWNDLDQPDSVWRVALINDMEQQVASSTVVRERRVTATMAEFYPHAEPFYRMYTFRFPRVMEDGQPLLKPGSRTMALRFTGPLGRTELTWRLK